jgi:hypothetical protein
LEGPLDLVFPEAAVIDLGKLVVFLPNCLAHVGLGILLQAPIGDQFFALELGGQTACDGFDFDLLRSRLCGSLL